MTERTSRNANAILSFLKSTHSSLKSMPHALDTSFDELDFASNSISKLLKILYTSLPSSQHSELLILSLAESFRITKHPFSSAECSCIFDLLLKLIPLRSISLSRFIQSGLSYLLTDSQLIDKFISIYPSLQYNKHFTADLIVIFLSANDKYKFLSNILNTNDSLLIKRVINIIDLSIISDSQYLTIYMNYIDTELYSSLQLPFRKIKNQNFVKNKSVSKIVEYIGKVKKYAYRDVFLAYYNEKLKILRREVLPAPNSLNEIELLRSLLINDLEVRMAYTALLSDYEEEIRARAVNVLNWEIIRCFKEMNMDELGLSALLLDKSSEVRKRIFDIVLQGKELLNGSYLIRKNNDNLVGTDNTAHKLDLLSQAVMIEIFKTLFKGCITSESMEYCNFIETLLPSFEFLYELKDIPGVAEFVSGIKLSESDLIELCALSYDNINFILVNSAISNINDNVIDNLLDMEVYGIIKHIKNKETHFKKLLALAAKLSDLSGVEMIVEEIKGNLKDGCLWNNAGDRSDKENNDQNKDCEMMGDNKYFIKAHTTDEFTDIDELFGIRTYPVLYYLSYKMHNDLRLIDDINTSNISDEQKVSLMLRTASLDNLHLFAYTLINLNLDNNTLKKLVDKHSMIASLIYFCCTGMVSISNTTFYLYSVKLLAYSGLIVKAKKVLRKYMNAVTSDTFNIFYTIACSLNNYVCEDEADSAVNKNLEIIAKEIVGMRAGKIVNYECDFHTVGFKFRHK